MVGGISTSFSKARELKTCLSHGVDGRSTHLVGKVVSLHHAYAVLAGDRAFHLNGTLDHAMYNIFGDFTLFVVEKYDS